MLIHEVCKTCKLTKKAIEYYEERQLIKPQILKNGYRDFSAKDIELLKKISILRKLGLSVPDIQLILNEENSTAMYNASTKKSMEIETLREKQELLQILTQNHDWKYIQMKLEILEQKQTISERLLGAFPGFYGSYLSLHFASYLNEPIVNQEQQEAFETILSFLDGVDLKIPPDLQEYFNEMMNNWDIDTIVNISENLNKAVQNPEKYLADNKELLEQYMIFKQSEEYKKSPAYRLQELFKKFSEESGYNDIFIPAMKKLSQSYQDYQNALERANKVFLQNYPHETIEPCDDNL